MNLTETVHVIAYLDRANALVAREGQAGVWHDALADLDVDDVMAGVRQIVRDRTGGQRWVEPGEVRAAARGARNRWIHAGVEAALALMPTNLDPDDLRYGYAEHDWRACVRVGIEENLTPTEAAAWATEQVRQHIADLSHQIEAGRP